MDKLLYITNSMKYKYGGAVLNRRNYNLLHDIYEDNLFVYEFAYVFFYWLSSFSNYNY